MQICESCKKSKEDVSSAVINSHYYSRICTNCLGQSSEVVSSGIASYERRRQYEDYAQDTIQPYDANGKPRSEFYRLYPETASKMFTPDEIDEIKRKI